jgi:hypothetical protein
MAVALALGHSPLLYGRLHISIVGWKDDMPCQGARAQMITKSRYLDLLISFFFFLSHFIHLLITLLIISVTIQPVSLCLQSGEQPSMRGRGAKSPLSRFFFLLMYSICSLTLSVRVNLILFVKMSCLYEGFFFFFFFKILLDAPFSLCESVNNIIIFRT